MLGMLVLIVAGHFVVAGWHGLAHLRVPVELSTIQTLFVTTVVMIAPIVGAVLCSTRYRVQGAAIVCLAMAASAAFGVAYHFVIPSPDHIAWVPAGPWAERFVHSAFGVLVSEIVGTLIGAMAWWHWSRANAWRT